jgi:hypothetical protein
MGRQALYNVFGSEGDLMALLETIKKAGLGAIDATNPVNVLFGTVTSVQPLKINVEQRFVLHKDNLVILKHYEPAAGDKVILLRVQGGQQYVVIGKVV